MIFFANIHSPPGACGNFELGDAPSTGTFDVEDVAVHVHGIQSVGVALEDILEPLSRLVKI